METSKVTEMRSLRDKIRHDVLSRYRAMKERGRDDTEARNVAAAQCATMPGARLGSHVYRRELDAMLDKRPERHEAGPRPIGLFDHWRNPT